MNSAVCLAPDLIELATVACPPSINDTLMQLCLAAASLLLLAAVDQLHANTRAWRARRRHHHRA